MTTVAAATATAVSGDSSKYCLACVWGCCRTPRLSHSHEIDSDLRLTLVPERNQPRVFRALERQLQIQRHQSMQKTAPAYTLLHGVLITLNPVYCPHPPHPGR